MGEEIFIPHPLAIYHFGKFLYRTVKAGFLTMRDKNNRKKEIEKFVKEVLTIEELEKIKEIIYSVIRSKVCATETPKFRILKEIRSMLIVTLVLRDEKEMKRLGVDREKFIKQYFDFLNIEGKGDEKNKKEIKRVIK